MIEPVMLALALMSTPEVGPMQVSQEQPLVVAKKAKKKKKRKKKKKEAAPAEPAPIVEAVVPEPTPAPDAAALTPVESAPLPAPVVEAKEPDPAPAIQPQVTTSLEEPSDVTLRLRKMADQMAVAAQKMSKNPRYQRFAVLPFEAVDADSKEKGLGLVVSDVVATTLWRDHRFVLVERSRLNAVLDEMALQQMGITDDSKAAEVGKVANADVLVVGQVALLGDKYKVTSKLIEVETANVAGMAETTIPAADLVSLSSEAVVLKSKMDAAFRSMVFPGWGQHYNREGVKGWVFTGLTGALLLGGAGFEVAGLLFLMAYSDYDPKTDDLKSGDPQIQKNLDNLYNTSQSQFIVGHVLLGATAAVWAYNVLDAYVSGVEGDEMVGAAGD